VRAEVSDYLDPATLTPESLYKLQSETWAQGAEQERERIIKLLETLDCDVNGKEHDCNPLDEYTIQDLIALIKGEQK
jgi:hypothetical protein